MLRSWNFDVLCFLFLNLFAYVTLKDITLCPPGWLTSVTARSCIKFVSEKETWFAASKKCQTLGGDLLNHYDKTIEKMIYGISDKRDQIQRAFWTGLNDLKKEGDFYWLNGTQKITNVPWSNFASGDSEDRDCALVMELFTRQMFIHQRCNLFFKFICEISPACTNNTFGVNCLENCNQNCGGPNNACDRLNGFCIDGCDAGYQGERCEDPCTNNTFGVNCSRNCNQNCGGPNNACDRLNGFCIDGCDAGYQGERCEDQCHIPTFGANCSETCSKTCGGPNTTCNNVNGYCIFGCVDGYQGDRCEDPIDELSKRTNQGSGMVKGKQTEDIGETGVWNFPLFYPLKMLAAVSAFILLSCLVLGTVFVLVAGSLDSAEKETGPEHKPNRNKSQIYMDEPGLSEVSNERKTTEEGTTKQTKSVLEVNSEISSTYNSSSAESSSFSSYISSDGKDASS
ncbi:hypothetical protein RRG08_002026 [Elysia crispata]|uniref:C-type lectin domain-containing protein n=1 Tax=Elysia crispata TaxID=231223 RepID=A0AAE1E9A9_9GAST|nr:hypothetical protein RRG08_002026 [Elysia crispata]